MRCYTMTPAKHRTRYKMSEPFDTAAMRAAEGEGGHPMNDGKIPFVLNRSKADRSLVTGVTFLHCDRFRWSTVTGCYVWVIPINSRSDGGASSDLLHPYKF